MLVLKVDRERGDCLFCWWWWFERLRSCVDEVVDDDGDIRRERYK